MINLSKLNNFTIENIIERLTPESKFENAILECSKWLIDCGNFRTEFKFIDDLNIHFKNEDSGKTYNVSYKWNIQKWKWEFILR
jgi:hypothetical protein